MVHSYRLCNSSTLLRYLTVRRVSNKTYVRVRYIFNECLTIRAACIECLYIQEQIFSLYAIYSPPLIDSSLMQIPLIDCSLMQSTARSCRYTLFLRGVFCMFTPSNTCTASCSIKHVVYWLTHCRDTLTLLDFGVMAALSSVSGRLPRHEPDSGSSRVLLPQWTRLPAKK